MRFDTRPNDYVVNYLPNPSSKKEDWDDLNYHISKVRLFAERLGIKMRIEEIRDV